MDEQLTLPLLIDEGSSTSVQTAVVIAFPGDRRIAKARHTAALWLRKSSRARETYWQEVARRLHRQLVTCGLSTKAADIAVGDFQRAVQCEIDRQSVSQHFERNLK